jgi:hypothetical protein
VDERLKWFAIGWLSVLLVKYAIVGLDDWNAVLHPGLVTAPNQQAFRKPLLGLLG